MHKDSTLEWGAICIHIRGEARRGKGKLDRGWNMRRKWKLCYLSCLLPFSTPSRALYASVVIKMNKKAKQSLIFHFLNKFIWCSRSRIHVALFSFRLHNFFWHDEQSEEIKTKQTSLKSQTERRRRRQVWLQKEGNRGGMRAWMYRQVEVLRVLSRWITRPSSSLSHHELNEYLMMLSVLEAQKLFDVNVQMFPCNCSNSGGFANTKTSQTRLFTGNIYSPS